MGLIGCNCYQASYKIIEHLLILSPIIATCMACFQFLMN
ncbi:MAG: META domain-containing protein [cyanobacterium endosymbiont of Rhopalodia gibba]